MKGVEHAVRIHRSLVEQGERRLKINISVYGCKTVRDVESLWLLTKALVEGAKAALEVWTRLEDNCKDDPTAMDVNGDYLHGAEQVIIGQATKWAPEMIKAGMEVPE